MSEERDTEDKEAQTTPERGEIWPTAGDQKNTRIPTNMEGKSCGVLEYSEYETGLFHQK